MRNAVDSAAANLVYAVGNAGTVYVCTSACNVASPTFAVATGTGTGSINLTGVYIVGAANGWISGPGGYLDECTTCNTTAGTWAQLAVGTSQNLAAVAGAAAADVWAVGGNGTVVSNISGLPGFTAQASGTTNALNDIDVVSATVAVAVGAACTVAVTTTGTSWTSSTISSSVCPAGTNLTGVDIVDATDGWAVGSGGLILACTATCTSAPVWAKLTVEPTTQNLNSVAAVKAGTVFDVWVVGAAGTVVTCSSATCSTAAAGFAALAPTNLAGKTLNGVFTLTGNEAWAVGSSGTTGIVAGGFSTALCDSAGSTGWTVLASPAAPMNAVFAQANTLVYAVGNTGTIEICTTACNASGATFGAASGTGAGTTNLTGVYLNGGHALVVGAAGFVDNCVNKCNSLTGATWGQPAVATTQNLVAASGATTTGWALGANGTIVSNSSGLAGFTSQAAGGSAYTLQGAVTAVHATVTFTDSAAPTNAALQLLVSGNAGTSWTAYALTTPAANTASTQEVNVTATVATASAVPAMQLCLQGTGGSGTFTTNVDLVHVDVN